jgi:hypothetical protein
MTDNRSVGRPGLNQGFNQARSVPVEHNKPRLNDQRRVRPHPAGEPPMGNRPNGGQQRNPKEPALGKERMQARDVPVKLMTEAELAEWNPFARKHAETVGGDAVAYQLDSRGKINLFHVRDGRIMGPPVEQESYDSLSTKINNMQTDAADLKQQRRNISINPRKAAKAMALTYMKQNGLMGTKVGELGREIAVSDFSAAKAAPAAPAAASPNGQNPASPYSIGSGPMAPNTGARAEWGRRAVKPAPARPAAAPAPTPATGWDTPPSPSGAARAPAPKMSGFPAPKPTPSSPFGHTDHRSSGSPPTAEEPALDPNDHMANLPIQQIDAILAAQFPPNSHQHWTPARIAALSEPNKRHLAKKVIANNSKMRMPDRVPPAMAAEGYEPTKRNPIARSLRYTSHKVKEGYPEASFDDHKEAAHSSRIGTNLNPTKHLQSPNAPDLNREFAQFRDLRIERVTEMAEQEIDEMLAGVLCHLGVAPMQEAETSSDFNLKNSTKPLGNMHDTIVRERRRWL